MPVLVKPTDETKGQIDDSILTRLAARYGFDDQLYILPIVPMNGKLVVLNAKSETTRKAVLSYGGQHYLLKEVPWYCSNKLFVAFMLSFNQFLFDNGFKVPEIITTTDHNLYATIDDTFYYIQKFVSGSIYSGKKDELFHAGQNLGALHTLSTQYMAKGLPEHGDRFRESVFRIAVNMVDILEQIAVHNRRRLQEHQSALLMTYCERAKKRVLEVEARCEDHYFQEYLQVHGDYNPFNLIYAADGEVLYTFDWENSALDHPAHDVAEGLLDFCFHNYRPYSTNFAALSATIDGTAAAAFLDGYCSANPTMYERIRPILPAVVGTVFVELYTLGVVRGDYDFETAATALDLERKLVRDVQQLLR